MQYLIYKALKIALLAAFAAVFLACSATYNGGLDLDEVNKPAEYWYQSMLKEIRSDNLEKADSYFTSLHSEHLNSPLLGEAMLILGRAHMQKEQYAMAGFYYDEYTKKFGAADNIDFIRFLKLQANYYAFKEQHRDQQLLLNSIKDAKDFTAQYPYSRYRPMVDTMLLRLELANLSLNEEISKLYKRRNHGSGDEYYRQKSEELPWLKEVLKEDAGTSWYKQLFSW